MIALPTPTQTAINLHDLCAGSIADPAVAVRIQSVRSTVTTRSDEYALLGGQNRLHTIQGKKYATDAVVLGTARKRDLVALYEQQMVAANKPARRTYDAMLITKNQRCPYCLFGEASTLDHFLPKSRFPLLSVTPINLVPCCKDCQFLKGRHVATEGSAQTLHPYFDHGRFVSARWVQAVVRQTQPVSFEFHAAPPAGWPQEDRARAVAHFNAHGLARRYSLEAGTQVEPLAVMLRPQREAGDIAGMSALLAILVRAYEAVNLNSWQAAMYRALATDLWYHNAPPGT